MKTMSGNDTFRLLLAKLCDVSASLLVPFSFSFSKKQPEPKDKQHIRAEKKLTYVDAFFLLMCFVKLAKNWFTQVLWLAGSPKSVDWGTLGPKRQTKAVLLISRLSAALGSQTNSACRFR